MVNRCCLGVGEMKAAAGPPLATLEEPNMSEKKVVLVTGAGRGMGVDIARAALDAGHRVVATARNADRVTQTLGAPTTCSFCRWTSPTRPACRPASTLPESGSGGSTC